MIFKNEKNETQKMIKIIQKNLAAYLQIGNYVGERKEKGKKESKRKEREAG